MDSDTIQFDPAGKLRITVRYISPDADRRERHHSTRTMSAGVLTDMERKLAELEVAALKFEAQSAEARLAEADAAPPLSRDGAAKKNRSGSVRPDQHDRSRREDRAADSDVAASVQ